MPEPGELWTLAQTMIWIFCARDDYPSTKERDEFINAYAAVVGQKEKGPALAVIVAQRRWGKYDLANDVDLVSPRGRPVFADRLAVGVTDNWRHAEVDLLDEIHRRQISVVACEIGRSTPFLEIPKLECAGLEFGEVDGEICARARRDAAWRWQSVRFDAGEVVARWPAREDVIAHVEEPSASAGDARTKTAVRLTPQSTDVVQALRKLYPDGPPSPNRKAIKAAVEQLLGREVSPATIDRARKEAWGPD